MKKHENWAQGCEKESKGNQNVAKNSKKGAKGSQRAPKRSQRVPEGSQKGTKGNQKGAKGSQRRAKGGQRRTKGQPKCIKKSMPDKEREKGATNINLLVNFGPILGAKNLQKPLVLQCFLDFRDFWKSWKNNNSFGANFGAHLEIRGSQNPPFSRDCYRRVTCRYTYPKKQQKKGDVR